MSTAGTLGAEQRHAERGDLRRAAEPDLDERVADRRSRQRNDGRRLVRLGARHDQRHGLQLHLYFDNTQTVSNETINLGNSSSFRYPLRKRHGRRRQSGPHPRVERNGQRAGYAHIADSGYSGDGIVNQGVINQTGSGSLYINGNAFTNSGTIDAEAAGGLVIDPTTFTNSGTIDVANGDKVTIEPTTFKTTASSLIKIEANSSVTIDPVNAWTNLGSITLAGGAGLYSLRFDVARRASARSRTPAGRSISRGPMTIPARR